MSQTLATMLQVSKTTFSSANVQNDYNFPNTLIVGEGINKSYFLILVPIGVIGNVLSFLVSKIYYSDQELDNNFQLSVELLY